MVQRGKDLDQKPPSGFSVFLSRASLSVPTWSTVPIAGAPGSIIVGSDLEPAVSCRLAHLC